MKTNNTPGTVPPPREGAGGRLHRHLMALLTKAGIDNDTRHELVYSWTNGRTESTRDLSEGELADLVWKIENDHSFSSNLKRTAGAIKELAIKEKRSTVLAIAQRTGIHEGTSFEKFNHWMETRSILKKRLGKYTFEELDELVKQMHALEANYKASAEKAGTKAWYKHYGLASPSPS